MLRSALLSLITFGAITLFSLLLNIVSARALGVEGRGAYAAVYSVAMLAAGLGQLGLGNAFVIRYRATEQINLHGTVYVSAVFAIVASAFIGATVLKFTPTEDYVAIVVLLASGIALTQLFSAMYQFDNNLKFYNLVRSAPPICSLLLAIPLWLSSSLTATNLLGLQATIYTIIGIVSCLSLLSNLKNKGTAPIQFWQTLKLGLKFHAIGVLGLITGNIDKVYLFINASLSDFGIYSVAIATSRLLGSIQESISTALFSKYAATSDTGIIGAATLAFRLSFAPLMAIAIVISFISESILVSIFGESYRAASTPFSILCFESAIGGGSWILVQYFAAKGKPELIVARQLAALLPIVILLPFIPDKDVINSLAWLLLAGSVVRLIITLWMIHGESPLSISDVFPTRRDYFLVQKHLFAQFQR